MPKIAITGSFSTGKTTLAKQLAKKLRCKLLPEVARQMIAEGYRLDIEATPELELLMAERQLDLEQEEHWVADRCMIDILAYSMVLFDDDKFLNELNDLLDKAKYDKIFYTPIEFQIKDDGIRSTDIEFQKKVDEAIKEILKTIPHIIVKGNKKQRLNLCIKHLSV